MIITRTPYRISFFGGGTDYPIWYNEHGGEVLATSINKYCYLICRYLPPFFEHKYRVAYSKVEEVKTIDEIKHPSVRACLKYKNIQDGVEIHHDGDLPARSGLGSSSSFTVGLLNALNALKYNMTDKISLAREAIHIERDILKENVGVQDQITAAIGGFNRLMFLPGDRFIIEPIILPPARLEDFHNHLVLMFTGLSRHASEIAAEQIKNTPNRAKELSTMKEMVQEAIKILASNTSLVEFGKLLHEGWLLKRSLSSHISTDLVDQIYEAALSAGAIGGKLLGAGGGGFMLFFVPPEKRDSLLMKLKDFLYVPFEFENFGSQIIFYAPSEPLTKK